MSRAEFHRQSLGVAGAALPWALALLVFPWFGDLSDHVGMWSVVAMLIAGSALMLSSAPMATHRLCRDHRDRGVGFVRPAVAVPSRRHGDRLRHHGVLRCDQGGADVSCGRNRRGGRGGKVRGRLAAAARVRRERGRLVVAGRHQPPGALGQSALRLCAGPRCQRDRGHFVHQAGGRIGVGQRQVRSQSPRPRRTAQAARKLLEPAGTGRGGIRPAVVGNLRHTDARRKRRFSRLPRGRFGRDRAARIIGKDRLSRALRYAHRTTEPLDGDRIAERRFALQRAVAHPLRLPDGRSRPLQGGERFAWPPGRRPDAGPGFAAARAARAPTTRCAAGSAATNSPS